jgi:hypothetical protein
MNRLEKLKNCYNCKHLNYYEGNPYEGEGSSGFFCNGRDYKNESSEKVHLSQLENEKVTIP